MKEKQLNKRKERYALRAFLWGAAVAALFIVPCIIKDKGMYLYYGDYNFQVIPFYQLMVDAVHKGEWGWNWYTDLGTSFVGGYTFYNLGSPFFWILLLFPSKAVPYLMGPLTILKFGLSSLTAYAFLRRYTKHKNNAVFAAMLYAFSGAAIYNMVFHFIDAMVLFPLLLCALDLYIYENKRGVFAVTVFACALTNYYLFAAEAVFCMIYWIVRMAAGSYKIDARRSFYLIFEAILGTGLATFILLPTAYHIIGSSRLSAEAMNGASFWTFSNGSAYLNTLISFFLPPEPPQSDLYVSTYAHTWSSITAFLPLFGMSGVLAVIFNKNKNKWLRVFYGVCAVFMCVPVLNSSFQFFTNFRYMRWFFMLLLIMSLGSVLALEDPSTKWKKAIGVNLTLTLAIIAIVAFTPQSTTNSFGRVIKGIGMYSSSSQFWTLAAAALVNIVLCVIFVSSYNRSRRTFDRYGALLLTAAIVLTTATSFIGNKVEGDRSVNPAEGGFLGVTEDMGIDDIQQWRSDIVATTNYTIEPYDSDSVATMDFAPLWARSDTLTTDLIAVSESGIYKDDENAAIFWQIPAFGSFHSTVSSSIDSFYNGVGFDRFTLSNFPLGMYGFRSMLGAKYLFTHSDNALSITDESGSVIYPGYKYLKSWNGFDIYENEYVVPMGTVYDKFMFSSDFEKIPQQYRHLVLLDTIVVDSLEDTWDYVEAKMKQADPEDYDFSQKEYFANCEARRAAGVSEFTRDKNGFEAVITTEPNGDSECRYVFFSVPYDKGWKAYVNGERVKINVADFGFMTVRVPAGQESTIRFTYHTPGTLYGFFMSGVCLFMLLMYLAVVKVRRNAEEAALPEEGGSAESDASEEQKNSDAKPEKTEAPAEEDFEDMSLFDIVKATEEQHMMHVYNRVPVVLERGSGAVGYDIDNKKYIDFTSGIGVNALGYSDGRWIDAVIAQLRSLQHMSNLYYNTTQIQLAETLCTKTGFARVFFANSGAEANECAIKIARKYGSDTVGESHTHIITLENSFHGRTITTLSATGQDVFHKHFQPFTEGFSFAKANDMDSVRACTTDDTCAVMIELIQGEGGVNPLDKSFVTELAAYCREKNLLLIVDEIQTGVGRTGRLYCYENYGIEPDVITSAKALGGGLPLSACLCNEKTKDVLTPGTNGTTFGGNPIACAGAQKILEIVADDDFLAQVREKGDHMRSRIKEMEGVKDVRGMGMMIGIVLERDNAGDVLKKCAENGLLVLTAKGLVRLLPPLNIEPEEIDEGLAILERSIGECK